MKSPVVAVALLALAGAACKKKEEAQARPATVPTVPPPTEGTAEPLPPGSPDGSIGVAAPVRLIEAADSGGWVMVCEGAGYPQRLRVVVGDGDGLLADRVVAATDRDLAVIDGAALVHVDAVARTRRTLGPRAPAVLDEESRRLVHVDGADRRKLVIRDAGAAPRTISRGEPVAALWSRHRRWLEIASGEPSGILNNGCGWAIDSPTAFPGERRATIDLDPAGLEAPERIGPELGITAAGEVTLDGVVVVEPSCVAEVVAALAEPPRALVTCTQGKNLVVGPGVRQEVGGSSGNAREQASISDHLVLGSPLVCIAGACVHLPTGRSFGTWDKHSIWSDERFLVRKDPTGVVIDDLAQERSRVVALPRVSRAVTVDTATGRRQEGPAPKPPAYVDAAGNYLLYGRHVIDVEAGALVKTLAEDALAIDRAGRVLLATAEGQGPLRWRRP